MTIVFPELPKGREFEECVSAYFQSSGLFIERNIVDKDTLEIDIIATDYENQKPQLSLVEVKSGDWGIKDIFKIKGWMAYLEDTCGISKGILVVSDERRDLEFAKKISSKINIKLAILKELSNYKETLSDLIRVNNVDERDISIWRLSYFVERSLIMLLKQRKKNERVAKRFQAMDNYYDLVNNEMFFTRGIIERAKKLYEYYQDNPNLSAKCGNEIMGNEFDLECEMVPERVFIETFYEGILTDLQISSFIEHKARLAILKCLVDYKISERFGKNQAADAKITFQFGDKKHELALLEIMPQSFKDALDRLAEHKYFFRYPVFWQWFMWAFGGFYITDLEETEFELISMKTGIPKEHISEALNVFDQLFPIRDKAWLRQVPNSKNKTLLMFPTPFAGVGSNLRRLYYTESHDYNELEKMLCGKYTFSDIVKWNNKAVELLEIYS